MDDKYARKSSMMWTKVALSVAKNQTTMTHQLETLTSKSRANQTNMKDRTEKVRQFIFPCCGQCYKCFAAPLMSHAHTHAHATKHPCAMHSKHAEGLMNHVTKLNRLCIVRSPRELGAFQRSTRTTNMLIPVPTRMFSDAAILLEQWLCDLYIN